MPTSHTARSASQNGEPRRRPTLAAYRELRRHPLAPILAPVDRHRYAEVPVSATPAQRPKLGTLPPVRLPSSLAAKLAGLGEARRSVLRVGVAAAGGPPTMSLYESADGAAEPAAADAGGGGLAAPVRQTQRLLLRSILDSCCAWAPPAPRPHAAARTFLLPAPAFLTRSLTRPATGSPATAPVPTPHHATTLLPTLLRL